MKKNYALFLKWMLALGLIFSLGFTGCENAVGETGPAGQDYFNKIQIVRVDKPATTVVVARNATALFGVQYYEDGWKEVPDPVTVAWKVYGAGQVLGEKSVTSPLTTLTSASAISYGPRNGYAAALYVGPDETCASLFVEASYKGWTHTVEVQVGIPYVNIKLEPGATTKIGTSHITQYNWVGRDDLRGKTANETTYLVYETRTEPVADLTGWDTTPDGVISYHLNDDIPVTSGQYVTFYEVDANDVNKIISYGYDQAYIRAQGTDTGGKIKDLGHGTDTITVYSNIRLPTIDELPVLRGLFGSDPWRTTHNGTGIDQGTANGYFALNAIKDGAALVAVSSAGSKIFDGKVTLAYEGDIFKDDVYDPNLYIPATIPPSWGGYDLSTPPSAGKEVKPNQAKTNGTAEPPFEPVRKTGWHRYVVAHSSGALTVSTGRATTSTSGDGVWVNQNNVTLLSTGVSPVDFNITTEPNGNLIEIDAGAGNTFKKGAAPIPENFTLNDGAKSIATWFVDPTTKYGMGNGELLPEASQKVTLVVDNAPFASVAKLTIKADQFDVGSQPMATGSNAVSDVYKNSGVTAKKVDQKYATIAYNFGAGPTAEEGKVFHPGNTITYTVKNATFSNPLIGPEGTFTGNATADKVFINWYTVTGSEWTVVAPTRNTTRLTKQDKPYTDPLPDGHQPDIADLDERSTWEVGPLQSYQSTLDVQFLDADAADLAPSGKGHGSLPYGKTYGVIITPGASNYPVLFVDGLGDPRPGEKALSQRIVGVVQD